MLTSERGKSITGLMPAYALRREARGTAEVAAAYADISRSASADDTRVGFAIHPHPFVYCRVFALVSLGRATWTGRPSARAGRGWSRGGETRRVEGVWKVCGRGKRK